MGTGRQGRTPPHPNPVLCHIPPHQPGNQEGRPCGVEPCSMGVALRRVEEAELGEHLPKVNVGGPAADGQSHAEEQSAREGLDAHHHQDGQGQELAQRPRLRGAHCAGDAAYLHGPWLPVGDAGPWRLVVDGCCRAAWGILCCCWPKTRVLPWRLLLAQQSLAWVPDREAGHAAVDVRQVQRALLQQRVQVALPFGRRPLGQRAVAALDKLHCPLPTQQLVNHRPAKGAPRGPAPAGHIVVTGAGSTARSTLEDPIVCCTQRARPAKGEGRKADGHLGSTV